MYGAELWYNLYVISGTSRIMNWHPISNRISWTSFICRLLAGLWNFYAYCSILVCTYIPWLLCCIALNQATHCWSSLHWWSATRPAGRLLLLEWQFDHPELQWECCMDHVPRCTDSLTRPGKAPRIQHYLGHPVGCHPPCLFVDFTSFAMPHCLSKSIAFLFSCRCCILKEFFLDALEPEYWSPVKKTFFWECKCTWAAKNWLHFLGFADCPTSEEFWAQEDVLPDQRRFEWIKLHHCCLKLTQKDANAHFMSTYKHLHKKIKLDVLSFTCSSQCFALCWITVPGSGTAQGKPFMEMVFIFSYQKICYSQPLCICLMQEMTSVLYLNATMLVTSKTTGLCKISMAGGSSVQRVTMHHQLCKPTLRLLFSAELSKYLKIFAGNLLP